MLQRELGVAAEGRAVTPAAFFAQTRAPPLPTTRLSHAPGPLRWRRRTRPALLMEAALPASAAWRSWSDRAAPAPARRSRAPAARRADRPHPRRAGRGHRPPPAAAPIRESAPPAAAPRAR